MSVSAPASRAGFRPWALAVGVATVALAATIGIVLGAFLLTGRASGDAGAAAGYVPADAVAYVEARLDLPGEQRAALEEILGRFGDIEVDRILGPGLAEELDEKLGESGTGYSYSADIAPWFDGRVAFAMLDAGDLPFGAMNPLGAMPPMDDAASTIPGAIAIIGTRDAAATGAFLDRVRADAESMGATATSESYAGTTIWTVSMADGAPEHPAGAPAQGAYALSGDELLLGASAEVVREALDVNAGSAESFGARADVAAAIARLPEDRVATFVSDSGPIIALLREQLTALMPELSGVVDVYASAVSMLQVGSVRFEGDRVVVDGVGSMPSRGMQNSERTLAQAVPAEALVYLDGTDIGSFLAELVAALKDAAAAAGQEAAIAQVEGILGADLEAFLAWVDDAAIVAGWDGTQPWGGLVITPTSVDEAELRLGQLRALAGLAGMTGADVPLTVTEATIDGVTVTRFAITGVDVAGEAGLEYAIADGRVLIGFGDTFVERVLATDAADSLAASDRFSAAVDAVGGAPNTSVVWADLAGIRTAAASALPEGGGDDHAGDIAPWLDPLGTLVAVIRVDGDLVLAQGALTFE